MRSSYMAFQEEIRPRKLVVQPRRAPRRRPAVPRTLWALVWRPRRRSAPRTVARTRHA